MNGQEVFLGIINATLDIRILARISLIHHFENSEATGKRRPYGGLGSVLELGML
jgi:hypothetical protein